MPHVTAEYSQNLADNVDIRQLIQELHETMIGTGLFEVATIKVESRVGESDDIHRVEQDVPLVRRERVDIPSGLPLKLKLDRRPGCAGVGKHVGRGCRASPKPISVDCGLVLRLGARD
ncbi:MAG: hypothetical protein J0H63_05730, partial [Rhizobiales bacterium]|nr:hypothetical protein [Hyphomicrobiales bacterium]